MRLVVITVAGSKWCTAAKSSDAHFMSYNRDGKLFYFLDKKAKSGSRFYKVAMLQKYDGDTNFLMMLLTNHLKQGGF